jgi:hypothetical protein
MVCVQIGDIANEDIPDIALACFDLFNHFGGCLLWPARSRSIYEIFVLQENGHGWIVSTLERVVVPGLNLAKGNTSHLHYLLVRETSYAEGNHLRSYRKRIDISCGRRRH